MSPEASKKAESPLRCKAVGLLNRITRLRRPRVEAEHLLLLMPSCLQFSECGKNVVGDTANCKRCGRCKIKDMLDLADEFGVMASIASGGRMALGLVERDGVEAVVAVACEHELFTGMRMALPKPVIGVMNLRPNGPCKDTDVDVAKVREALEWFLRR